MITFQDEDIFNLAELIRRNFELDYIHVYYLLNKINPHFKHLITKFSQFIDQPAKAKVILLNFESFEDSLFLKFKIKMQEIYVNNVDRKSSFVKIQKDSKVVYNYECSELFSHYTNMSSIIKLSTKNASKFFEGITKKKYTIQRVNDFNKFCRDLNFFLETHLVLNPFIYKFFL